MAMNATGPAWGAADIVVRAQRLDFDLVALSVLRRMKVAKILDEQIPAKQAGPQSAMAQAQGLPPPTPGPSVGQCVELMVLNILSGRVALYSMGSWLQGRPTEAYWGKDMTAERFTDDALARSLDSIYSIGLEPVFTTISGHAISEFGFPINRMHSDGTMIPLQGAYDLEESTEGPRPMQGYNKKGPRSGLQLVIGATVQQHGIPMAFGVYDGNTTDQPIYRDHMERISKLVPDPEKTTFVADCKLCDQYCLGALRHQKFQVVTLMPKTFNLHDELIERALAQTPVQDWPEVCRRPGRSQEDNDAVYHGVVVPVSMSLAIPLMDDEGRPLLDKEKKPKTAAGTEDWHAVVLCSSNLAKVHASTYDRKLDRARGAMELSAKKLAKATFASQDDAEKGLKDWNTSHSTDLSGWTVVSEIRSETHPLPRTGRGRPRKDAPVQTEQVFVVTVRLEPDEKARVLARSHHGLFILVTSHAVLCPKSPSDGPELKTPTEILEIYREQIEVEGGFRWIKAPSQVTPMFLHKPSRIAALGFVFAIALMLYRILQYVLRNRLRETDETIAGHHGRPTQNPTVAFVQRLFSGVIRITMETPTGVQSWMQGFTEVHRRILTLFGLPSDLYERVDVVE